MISDWICLGLGEEEEGREGTRRDDSMALCVCREGSTTEILLPAFIYQFVTRRRTRLGWGRGDASSFSLPFSSARAVQGTQAEQTRGGR